MILRLIFIIFSSFYICCDGSIITRVVRTKYGDITGTIVTPNVRFLDAVEVYKGIPYAAPPVGNLRFMPPVSGALWTGVKMADKFAPVCPQNFPDISNETVALKHMSKGRLDYLKRLLPYLRDQSEDCLYLNIYAPTQVVQESFPKEEKEVMRCKIDFLKTLQSEPENLVFITGVHGENENIIAYKESLPAEPTLSPPTLSPPSAGTSSNSSPNSVLEELDEVVHSLEKELQEGMEYLKTSQQTMFQDWQSLFIIGVMKDGKLKIIDYHGDELKKYPVLVFIHGESYEWNSGNPYDGTVLASFAGLVVVTINYRLGVLGFLNTNTDIHQKSPSNYGLMDQIAALHWLQENVAYFGGDPSNVTVAGHGTGASCVNFLMSSTAVPEGLLFHRAVLMSGSSLSPWALVKDPSMYAKQVAQSVNCSFQLPHLQLLKCLRDRPLHTLIQAKVQVPEFNTAFGPNVDGVVIDLVMNDMRKIPSDSAHVANVDSPHENVKWPFFGHFPLGDYASIMLNNPATKQKLISKYSRYDLMTGIVPAESFFIFTNEDVQYGIEPERRAKILKTFVKNTYRYHLSEILATVVNEYTEWERPIQHPINIRDETLEAISDAQYVAPVTQTADLHSSAHRNSYFYVFEYQSKYGDYQQRQGCVHGEELPYLFGAPLMNGLKHFPQNYTKSEISLSEAFMLYISNFARTGNPNDPRPNQESQRSTLPDRSRLKNIEWTPYESVHKKYLSLDTKLKLKNHYRAHKLSFWLNLIPELHKPGSEDVPPSHHQFQPEEVMYPQQSFKVSSSNTSATNTVNKVIARNESFNSTFDLPVVMIASSSSDRNAMTPNDAAETVHDEQLTSKENGFSNYSLALIITIGIGCVLLTFNVLVFIIVYHKKDNTRSNSDKNSGSIGSISSNNSLILGIEGAPQCSRKITENGGPSLNIKTNQDPSDRHHRSKTEAINTSMVDQSVMFVLEPLKQPDYDHQFKRRSDIPDLGCSSCSTLPKLSSHTSNKSTEVSPSYWSSKLNDDLHGTRSPCELGLGTVPRPPKSILKHQSVNTDGLSKCSDDFSRIRV